MCWQWFEKARVRRKYTSASNRRLKVTSFETRAHSTIVRHLY